MVISATDLRSVTPCHPKQDVLTTRPQSRGFRRRKVSSVRALKNVESHGASFDTSLFPLRGAVRRCRRVVAGVWWRAVGGHRLTIPARKSRGLRPGAIAAIAFAVFAVVDVAAFRTELLSRSARSELEHGQLRGGDRSISGAARRPPDRRAGARRFAHLLRAGSGRGERREQDAALSQRGRAGHDATLLAVLRARDRSGRQSAAGGGDSGRHLRRRRQRHRQPRRRRPADGPAVRRVPDARERPAEAGRLVLGPARARGIRH